MAQFLKALPRACVGEERLKRRAMALNRILQREGNDGKKIIDEISQLGYDVFGLRCLDLESGGSGSSTTSSS